MKSQLLQSRKSALLPSTEETYLRSLGNRVREARARRGMSRKILAHDSRVSERYLAQLEAGEGNVSVLLLRQIARALDLPLEALIHDGPEPSVDLVHATEFLRQLPPEKLSSALYLLTHQFSPIDLAARRARIALIGLRGAGKSTLGAMLAQRLDVPFIELDRAIEQKAGVSLSVIFDLYGQSGFRRFERECLEEILAQHPKFVLATGGSIVSEPGTYELLLSSCYTLWLRASPEDHMKRVIAQGDMRPMAQNREAMSDLKKILEGREPLYRRADSQFDTSDQSPDQVLALVLQSLSDVPLPLTPTNDIAQQKEATHP